MTHGRALTFVLIAALWLSVAACSNDAIEWKEIRLDGPPLPASLAFGHVWPRSPRCEASVRAARKGSRLLAAWWAARNDSSGLLLVSQSPDGGKTWTPPVVADSTDRSVRGCGRPPPAIAADSASGYVYLAYFAEPASAAGFSSRIRWTADGRFHRPVPIVFGDNAAWVSVSVQAIEWPSRTKIRTVSSRVLASLPSRSMGHIFKPGELVSSDNRARSSTDCAGCR
jgi:hypothetical protein